MSNTQSYKTAYSTEEMDVLKKRKSVVEANIIKIKAELNTLTCEPERIDELLFTLRRLKENLATINQNINGVNNKEIRTSGSFRKEGFVIIGNRDGFAKYYAGKPYSDCSVKPAKAFIFEKKDDALAKTKILEDRNVMKDCTILHTSEVREFIKQKR